MYHLTKESKPSQSTTPPVQSRAATTTVDHGEQRQSMLPSNSRNDPSQAQALRGSATETNVSESPKSKGKRKKNVAKKKEKRQGLELASAAGDVEARSSGQSPQQNRTNKPNHRQERVLACVQNAADDRNHEDDESEEDEEDGPGAHHVGGSSSARFTVAGNVSSQTSSSPFEGTEHGIITDPHLLQAEIVDEDARRREFQNAVDDAVHNALQDAAVVAVAVDEAQSNRISTEKGKNSDEVDKALCSKKQVVTAGAALIIVSIVVALLVVFLSQRPNSESPTAPLSETKSPTPLLGTMSPTQAPVLLAVPDCDPPDCANIYNKGGCLYQNLNRTSYIRMCTSEDAPDNNGECIRKSSPPMEIRIASQNWDTAIAQAWILQIILSEIVGVPATIETGLEDRKMDFYDIENRMEYGLSNLFDALELANDVGECTTVANKGEEEYAPCAHVLSEVNNVHFEREIENLQINNVIGAPQNIGFALQEGLYVPKHTLLRDPSLVSYQFLSGEENRQKLAETFLTPTTWHDYCETVSPTQCLDPDHVAARPPIGSLEDEFYFSEGLYTGYFRVAEQNNCDLHPSSCTGYVVVFPCGWSTNVEQQLHHNSIFLKGEPLSMSFGKMIQIWQAAHATLSDVIMTYWSPESLLYDFIGTESEFQRVQLPTPSQQCLDNRVDDFTIRCSSSPNLADLVGHPDGACDNVPEAQSRLVTSNVRAENADAYNAINSFVLLKEDVDEILGENKDKDLRDATCEWVVNHLSLIESRLA